VDATLPLLEKVPLDLAQLGVMRLAREDGPFAPSVGQILRAAGLGPPEPAVVLFAVVRDSGNIPDELRHAVTVALGGSYALRTSGQDMLTSRNYLAVVESAVSEWYRSPGNGIKALLPLARRQLLLEGDQLELEAGDG
jgi:hypothetical protein